jgi:hypothetical protein
VLLKGRQSCQSTTMLCNECTHTFLYVFRHCGEYTLGLLLILISKSFVHFCLLVSCVCMYLGGCLNWHILSLPCCCCCQGSRVFIVTLGSVFHWKVLAWLELKSNQEEETTHSLPSMMCPHRDF